MFFKHKILGLLFNFFSLFPLRENRVVFVVDEGNSFGLPCERIMGEFRRHGSNFTSCFFLKDKFDLVGLFKLATSGFVFLDDNFFPLAFMNFKDGVSVVQLWHAPGVFKRFGYTVLEDGERKSLLERMGSRISLLSVTSGNLKGFYSEAFQVDEDKVKAFGFPRLDYYGDKDLSSLKESFIKDFPEARGKKIVLYAPTFREEARLNNVFNFLDVDLFNKVLGDEYVLVVRLHPKISSFVDDDRVLRSVLDSDKVIDLSDYPVEQDLVLLSDVIVTDYSSIMLEGVFIDKPVVFFAYDLEEYLEGERGFYFDYVDCVPGPIVSDTEGLIDNIKVLSEDRLRLDRFLSFEFDYRDSSASKRIVDFLLNE